LSGDTSISVQAVSAAKLAHTHIRIDFFRLHPSPKFEEELKRSLNERLGEGNVAFFKALGHYDLICIYTGFEERQALFKGSIHGIRSFSTIDCACWEDMPAETIISRLKDTRVIGLNIATFRPDFLSANGGVHNSLLLGFLASGDFRMTSFSWGEQVILLPDHSLNSLWGRSAILNQKLEPISYDVHSLMGINLTAIEALESSPSAWEEPVADYLGIEWNIDLKCLETGAAEQFSKRLKKARSHFGDDFTLRRSKCFLSPTQLTYRLSGSNWGSIIRGIRSVRSWAEDLLIATRLQIYQKKAMMKEADAELND
jgi:hypothetical protein